MNAIKIVIIGSGGREHALAWRCVMEGHDVIVAPGSDGIAAMAGARTESVAVGDHDGLVELVTREDADLVVIGPEQPLVEGLADRLVEMGVATVGPGAEAASLEGSKAAAKNFMSRHSIPTARFRTVASVEDAMMALDQFQHPPVVKASGLAAGKGVTVPDTFDAARAAILESLEGRRFGEAGATLVLEERLIGQELSYFALTDGTNVATFSAAQDHKRLGEGDTGPNTGGMGAYCPAPLCTPQVEARILEKVVRPTLGGLAEEGRPLRGVLFCGLMIDALGEPSVIEYNVRFGDPEIQPLLFGLETPLVPHLLGAATDSLVDGTRLVSRPACTVVLASAGYPASSTHGTEIRGIERAAEGTDVCVFHAGTRRRPVDGQWMTAGGRVLGVCGRGPSLDEAVARAYNAVDQIEFEGAQLRRDIAATAANRT